MTPNQIQEALDCSPESIATFFRYLTEESILAQILEVLADDRPHMPEATLRDGLMKAIDLVYRINFGGRPATRQFDLRTIVNDAPAFEFLVRCANRLHANRPWVFPAELIPEQQTVEMMLCLFRTSRGFSATKVLQATG